MNDLIFAATVAVAWIGLICGFCLALIAPEELSAGKRYFAILLRLMISISVAIALYARMPWWIAILALLLVFIDGRRTYIFAGVPLYLAAPSTDIFIASASAVFVAGLALGSLESAEHIKGEKLNHIWRILGGMVVRHAWFVPLGILPYILAQL
jgi:hypothetical protein